MTRTIGLLCLLALSLLQAWQASRVSIGFSLGDFLGKAELELEQYARFQERFGSDDDFLVLVHTGEAGVLNRATLEKVQVATDAIRLLQGVRAVVSPADLTLPEMKGPVVVDLPVLPWRDSTWQGGLPEVLNLPVFPLQLVKEKALALLIATRPGLDSRQSAALCDSIRLSWEQAGLPLCHLAGKAAYQGHMTRVIREEGVLFYALAACLMLASLALSFRRLVWVLAPLGIIFLAIVWTLGLVVEMGFQLNFLTTLMPTLLLVVGMSDIVHFTSRYLLELRNHPPREAFRQAFRELGLSTFLTSFTTALGFLALLTSGVAAFRQLGSFAAVGVMITYGLTMAIFAWGIAWLPRHWQLPAVQREDQWEAWLRRRWNWISGNRRTILWGHLALLAIAGWGISLVRVNSYLIDGQEESSQIMRDLAAVETHFYGLRNVEIVVEWTDSLTWTDPGLVSGMEKAEAYLRDTMGARQVLSPLALLRTAHYAVKGGEAEAFRLPESPRDWSAVRQALRLRQQELPLPLVHEESRSLRISAQLVDEGSAVAIPANQALQARLSGWFPGSVVYLTGGAFLFDKNTAEIPGSVAQGLLLALVVSVLIIMWLFRSWRLGWLSALPNLIPLATVLGLMGFLQIDLRSASAVVFTIGLGIVLDNTLHFLANYRHQLRRGASHEVALEQTFLTTGKAMILSSVVIAAGFAPFLLSQLEATWLIGLLITSSLLLGLLADLFLLPALLLVLARQKEKQAPHTPAQNGPSRPGPAR